MSDSKQKDETLPKENMSLLRGAMRDTWLFTKESFFRLTHLADDTDIEGTISSIRRGIVLKGSNLWVLICSVMIASIGLDLNSPAVIIGAMLISPLMSPILGIGLAVGMNDRSTLALSFRNFALAIVLSMFTAWVYFKITPLGEFTDEMQGRKSMIKGGSIFSPNSITLALNIPTYLALYGYGYRNIYELNELVNIDDPRVKLEGHNGISTLNLRGQK